jgi:CheY-like chemotaxis protein
MEIKKRILWIDDDYYAIRGLVRPLEEEGVIVDNVPSGLDAFERLKTEKYDLLIVDMIIPLARNDDKVNVEAQEWENEEYVGVGLVKWLREKSDIKCPILLLSVIDDPIGKYELSKYINIHSIIKRGLFPSKLREEVHRIWGG